MKETELAKDIVKYMDGYDLYFEVMGVDIVAKSKNILTAIETKITLNFKVIEQAFNNRNLFHYSYIAVPYAKNRSFAHRICKDYGLGVIEAYYSPYNGKLKNIAEIVKPKFNRKAVGLKYIPLTDEMKNNIPGASGKDGTTRTAFKFTVEAMERYISRHEGCTFKELFDNIDHHYHSFASARNSTYQWIRNGIIKNIYVDNGKLYLNKKIDEIYN